MTDEEVKTYLFKQFLEWMKGQTVGINSDGTTNYYVWDVERFKR